MCPSATLSAAGQVTALAFQTGYESPPDNYLAPEYLVVRSLNRGGLVSYFGPGDDAQHGTITPLAAPVPEPSSLARAVADSLQQGLKTMFGIDSRVEYLGKGLGKLEADL